MKFKMRKVPIKDAESTPKQYDELQIELSRLKEVSLRVIVYDSNFMEPRTGKEELVYISKKSDLLQDTIS